MALNARSKVADGAVPYVHNASTYTNWGCRCAECRRSWAMKLRIRRYERRLEIKQFPWLAEHGSHNTYTNWMCRCPACTEAHRAFQQKRRADLARSNW